jgi:hypothetical protein
MEQNNRYQNGKIYKIISPHTEMIYIGSTCKPYLRQRLFQHKESYNRWIKNKLINKTYSYDILQFGDAEIILIENYSCNSKDELRARERYHIEQNINIVVNKCIPLRTRKEWRDDNVEHLKIKKKEEYLKNIEKYKQYDKERGKIKINCECGAIHSLPNRATHLKTEKHQTYMMIQTL